MTQVSRPQPEKSATYPDAGPYSADQWAERMYLETVGDDDLSNERAQLRGPLPNVLNKLACTTNGTTITILTGAAECHGHRLLHGIDDAVTVTITPSTPASDRQDRVVVVQNNTNAAYNTNLSLPVAYAGGVPAYSTRLAILRGDTAAWPNPRALVQSASYWMIPIAQYSIANTGAITNLADDREFAGIEKIVGVYAADNATIEDALIIGTQVDSAATFGTTNIGTAIKARIEDSVGTLRDAARLAIRYTNAVLATLQSRFELWLTTDNVLQLCGVVTAPTTAGAADGGTRGPGSVDWQGKRSLGTMIASGDSSVVSGGEDNISSGSHAACGGGYQNEVSGDYASSAGGDGNTVSGDYAMAAGNANTVSGDYAIAFGDSNQATGNGAYCPGGRHALANKYSQIAHASGQFAAVGDAQGSEFVSRATVTHSDANWYELHLDGVGASERMVIAASSAWAFDIILVGMRQNAAARWAYHITGLIQRDNANNTTLDTSNVTTVFESDANFNARVQADDVNEALIIQVTDAGSSGVVVRWVATTRTAEAMYP